MTDSCAFTIVSKNYLPYARALMKSLAEHHPGVRTFVLLADKPDGCFAPEKESFEVVEADSIGIEDFQSFSFKYNIVEMNTAVKPFFFDYLFAKYGFRKIIYLDPDILVFRPLDGIFEALEGHSIVLTPHFLTPPPEDGLFPRDIDILKVGTFNLGFLGLSRGESSGRLLSWWKERLYDKCLQAPLSGYAVDQIWISLVPAMFDDYHVLREPGYNVAYWNLHERSIRKQDGEFGVNGGPLYFFHFSGFDPDNMEKVSKYQNRFALADVPHLRELFEAYRESIMANGYREAIGWPYHYGQYRGGGRISELARGIYWGLGVGTGEFGNPFEGFWPRLLRPRRLRALLGGRVLRALLDKAAVFAWKRILKRRG